MVVSGAHKLRASGGSAGEHMLIPVKLGATSDRIKRRGSEMKFSAMVSRCEFCATILIRAM